MKFTSTTILIFLSTLISAQINFEKQVKLLLGDTVSCFTNFKKDFKELQEIDSVFTSTFAIEKTSRNEILFSKGLCMYMSVIVDSVKEKIGKKIVEDWKNKIYYLKGYGFDLEQKKVEKSWNPAKYGYTFSKGNVYVDIVLYPQVNNSSLYIVTFSISKHELGKY